MTGHRVLQLCHDYKGPFRALCGQYAAAFDDEHVTTVFLCGEENSDVARDVGGDEVIFLDLPRRALRGLKVGALLKLNRFLKAHSFDLVIAQRYRPVYFSGILSLFNPIPVILGVTHEHEVYRARARQRVIRYGKNIVLIGVSQSVSRDLESDMPGLETSGRLFTVPNSIDPERANEMVSRAEAKARLGLPDKGFVFGTVGRLIDKKEHYVLIDGFARYAEDGGDGDLAIVGDGPLAPMLREQAASLGIADRVHFAGHVPQAINYLKAFDSFVLASGELEAFGVVLLEAMLAHLPIISSSAPGPMEVVADCAMTFAPRDSETLADRFRQMRALPEAERVALGERGADRFHRQFTQAHFREVIRALPPVRRALPAL